VKARGVQLRKTGEQQDSHKDRRTKN